jgi:hypothetical protein
MSNNTSNSIIYQLQTKDGLIYKNYGEEAVIEHNLPLNHSSFFLIDLIRSKEPDLFRGVVNNRSIGLYQLKNGDEVKFTVRSPISDIDTADSSPPLLVRFEKVTAATPGEKENNLNYNH